jgi:hypothetical protein
LFPYAIVVLFVLAAMFGVRADSVARHGTGADYNHVVNCRICSFLTGFAALLLAAWVFSSVVLKGITTFVTS